MGNQAGNAVYPPAPPATVTFDIYAAAQADIAIFESGMSADAGPQFITVGPDRNLWFTETKINKIGKITTAGVITEYGTGITPGASPRGIVAGPDGNLWFVELSNGRIGKITTSGVVTEYTGITPGAGAQQITMGPDGNLWFSEFDKNRIGKITTSGVVTEYVAGTNSNASPYGIATGPDGLLWFPELVGNRIGKMTTNGQVTEYSAGISNSAGPASIVAGPDGNLWFTEWGLSPWGGGSKIGKITPSGVVTEYSAGISIGAGLNLIAAGPDGNLWFTESNGNRVGRITTDGVVTEYATPAHPIGITAGPDGNIWVAAFDANKIVRITPGPIPPSISSSFGSQSVGLNRPVTLHFSIANPNSLNALALEGVGFANRLPNGLVVATPNAVSNSCGGTIVAVPGSDFISLSGGFIPPPLNCAPPGCQCSMSVNVVATSLGLKTNTTGAVFADRSGPGAVSTAALSVFAVPPDAPTITSIGANRDSARVTFAPPSSDGGSPITSYTVTCNSDGQPAKSATGTGTSVTVTGLTKGLRYLCSVVASNALGTSIASASRSVTPKVSTVPLLFLLLD